eukprot:240622-Alexandrium_andersonii.AAC.1
MPAESAASTVSLAFGPLWPPVPAATRGMTTPLERRMLSGAVVAPVDGASRAAARASTRGHWQPNEPM